MIPPHPPHRAQPDNLILIGFMGTGKSSVGRRLAAQLGFEFIDTDQLIVTDAGRSIATLFADEGEAAFRLRETAMLRSLAGRARAVIATGGGAVLAPENRALLRTFGFVVWLTAPEATIFERVSRNQQRPLLRAADPRSLIQTLLEIRQPLYAETADCTIDTGNRSHDEVAAEILAAARARPPADDAHQNGSAS